MLLVVFICYTVGVILAPFTENFYTLIGLRILQGVAVALVPVSVRIARDLFPPAKFPFAQGMILSMYQGGSAVGLVLGAAVVYFIGWQGVFLTAIPFALLFLFLLWKFIPKVGEEKIVKDIKPRHFSKIIDIPGLITLILTVSTFMLSITFLGEGSDQSIALFWIFLAIGIVSIVAFFAIEKRSKIPLVDLKLAFHRIIRVGNVIYLLIGVVQYIIFSTIPTLGQTPEPYGLGLNVLQVGGLQLPQALVFVVPGTYSRNSGCKIWKPQIHCSRFHYIYCRYSCSHDLSLILRRSIRLLGIIRSRWSICDIISKCDYLLHTA